MAELFLDGNSLETIANHFSVSVATIKARVRIARAEFPHLPWSERKVRRGANSTTPYSKMIDGEGSSGTSRSTFRVR